MISGNIRVILYIFRYCEHSAGVTLKDLFDVAVTSQHFYATVIKILGDLRNFSKQLQMRFEDRS